MEIKYILLAFLIALPLTGMGFWGNDEEDFNKQQIDQQKEFDEYQYQLQSNILEDRLWREEQQPSPDSQKILNLEQQINQLKEYR